jgi:hypothetical protein
MTTFERGMCCFLLARSASEDPLSVGPWRFVSARLEEVRGKAKATTQCGCQHSLSNDIDAELRRRDGAQPIRGRRRAVQDRALRGVP